MINLNILIYLFIIPFFSFAQVNAQESQKELIIRFDKLSIQIDNIEVWDENEILKNIQKDTVIIDLDIGEILTGDTIKIINSGYDQINIFQRIENSVTIMNEGPHCDLLDWKHYYSDWIEIENINKNQFQAIKLTTEQMEKFLPVDLEEFINAVSLHCGESWAELIKNVKSVTEYHCGISTSRIFLKLVLKDNKNNKSVEKLIVFEVPMGC